MNYKLLQWLKHPWLGTSVLTILGIAINCFKLDLSVVLQFIFGGTAALIILRLYGLRFAAPAVILINLPFLWTDYYGFLLIVMELELIFVCIGSRLFPKSSLLRMDAAFWVLVGLPLLFIVYQYVMEHTDRRLIGLLTMNNVLNGIMNGLAASIIVESLLSRIAIGHRPFYPISLGRIIFKYLLASVVLTSVLVMFVNGRQQFEDIVGYGSEYMTRSSRLYIQQIQQNLLVRPDRIQLLMIDYKKDFAIDSLLVDDTGQTLYTTMKAPMAERFAENTGYQTLLLEHQPMHGSMYQQFPDRPLYKLERWQESYLVMNVPLLQQYRLILTMPLNFYLNPYYAFYLCSIIKILLVVILALILAWPISRKLNRPLMQLAQASNNIPSKIKENRALHWPETNILEVRRLIRNFKSVVSTMEYQYLQIKKDKELLEIRVVERTFDLAESEAQKSAILQMAIDGIISTDSQLRITEFNPAAEQMFRCRQDDVIGRPLSDIILLEPADDGESCIAVQAIRLDGTLFPVELTRSKVLAEGNSFRTFFVHDLTEEEHLKQQHTEQERQLQLLSERLLEEQGAAEKQKSITGNLLQSVEEGVIMCDSQQLISFINPTMQTWFDLDDYTGRPITELLIHMDQLTGSTFSLNDRLEHYMNSGEHWEQGELIRLNNNRILSLYVTPVIDPIAEIKHGFLLVFRDCTEEKRVRQMQDELITVVSHELRTPLSAIMGYIEMLTMYEDMPAAKRQEFMHTIQQEGNRLSRLLDDFLDSQRIEARHIEYHMSCLPVRELVQTVCYQWDIHSRHRIHIHGDGEEMYILGDQHRMIQVIHNLISNALKYSPDSMAVDISVKEEADSVVIAVEDYGIGIPEQDQPHVFRKFFRSHSAASRKVSGTGLGLYIANLIVNDHQGQLQVLSNPGHGSTFILTLPKYTPSQDSL
ncbi:sensor histidine kinase [Paenibacillus dauci]|uniref:sensor histidine kinase n=1 Tax=Paenibacillus dauci TaxID=1567106 RepID=UPI000619F86C|nr:ATP-binding protein [Paenibacillus dauci]